MPAKARNFLPSIIWTAVILVLTLLPGNYIPRVGSFWNLFSPDKLIHIFLFSVLALLLFSGFFKQYPGRNQRYITGMVLAFSILLAVLTELLQAMLPLGRSGNVYDTIADFAGISMGWLIFFQYRKKKQKKLPAD
ncbi:MAG: VanZ family protein [Lentimicrobium sp.]|uniref:VanZ like family protein n=1 Tax=Lentimicrobium saccharophilum TaxID=1678841 RepID=A0A0S7BYP6_9BACT|nr:MULTISPECIES: VanZ family protein [Lentimicrobium]MCO5257730.1 VanZ family protein [Lentimicrobium sp.]MCO5261323.1 VanZ family protein [Lentimicrobium sp.]GAP42086.1 vanZ like family protein [Lentimicrobium saccharophilum]